MLFGIQHVEHFIQGVMNAEEENQQLTVNTHQQWAQNHKTKTTEQAGVVALNHHHDAEKNTQRGRAYPKRLNEARRNHRSEVEKISHRINLPPVRMPSAVVYPTSAECELSRW